MVEYRVGMIRIWLFLWLLLLGTGCQRSRFTAEMIQYGGMETPNSWILEGGRMDQGILRLVATPETPVALASQLLPPLADEGDLVLSVTARAVTADAPLCIDLYGFERDDPKQQLTIESTDMTDQFTSSVAVLPSGSSDRGIWFRIFTESTNPIEIDHVSLLYLSGK